MHAGQIIICILILFILITNKKLIYNMLLILIIGVVILLCTKSLSQVDQLNSSNTIMIKGGKDPILKTFKINHSRPVNKEVKAMMDPYALQIIQSGQPPSLSHVHEDAEFAESFSRILEPNAPTLPYARRKTVFKRALHWGQLKLMLTEIEFLSVALKNKDIADDRPIYMVYAGAAPGHHIAWLSRIFPMIHFELYDPNDFAVKDNAMIKTHVQFFTDEDAKRWDVKDKHVIFCSDIRTEPASEENVKVNMDMQLTWWKLIKPQLAMFKFRLPWHDGFTEYPMGDIYIQPYPGPTSTETRLIVKRDAPMHMYNNKTYESQLFYHNSEVRLKKFRTVLGDDLDINTHGVDNCYDCASFINIVDLYLDAVQFDKDKAARVAKIKSLIIEIQNNITGKHTIKSNTILSLNNAMQVHLCALNGPCGEKTCMNCFGKKNTIKSRATWDANLKAIKASQSRDIKHGSAACCQTEEKIAHDRKLDSIVNEEVVIASETGLCNKTRHHIGFLPDGDKYDTHEI